MLAVPSARSRSSQRRPRSSPLRSPVRRASSNSALSRCPSVAARNARDLGTCGRRHVSRRLRLRRHHENEPWRGETSGRAAVSDALGRERAVDSAVPLQLSCPGIRTPGHDARHNLTERASLWPKYVIKAVQRGLAAALALLPLTGTGRRHPAPWPTLLPACSRPLSPATATPAVPWNAGDDPADGCNARNEVLLDEAVEPPTVGSGCRLTGGRWWSYYDATWVTSPAPWTSTA